MPKTIFLQHRISWDTAVKHYVRKGLIDSIPEELQYQIPKSNYYRWKNEPDNKYLGCQVADYINQELELIQKIGQHSKLKKINESYFRLSEALHQILTNVNGIKQAVAAQKDLIVNTIENVKTYISVDKAIKIFNLSRGTYQNYKTLVKNKCDHSYFLWCLKKNPHQLLKREILKIKTYMDNPDYQYWSKSSVYYKAVRDHSVSFCLSTWYKYCKLLGYSKNRFLRPKQKYTSLISSRPNQIWCADVTIFKTTDGVKHYLHFLMDHYSKKIVGYRIEKSSSARAIQSILNEAIEKHKPHATLHFLTDGGSENVNQIVSEYLKSTDFTIKHLIAQRDIQFSNSGIESFNKVIKHQFLLPRSLNSHKALVEQLPEVIDTYNTIRPQHSLAGNTPNEIFDGKSKDFSRFSVHFKQQQLKRIEDNQRKSCKICDK